MTDAEVPRRSIADVPEASRDAVRRAVIRHAIELVADLRADAARAAVDVAYADPSTPHGRLAGSTAYIEREAADRLAAELDEIVERWAEAES